MAVSIYGMLILDVYLLSRSSRRAHGLGKHARLFCRIVNISISDNAVEATGTRVECRKLLHSTRSLHPLKIVIGLTFPADLTKLAGRTLRHGIQVWDSETKAPLSTLEGTARRTLVTGPWYFHQTGQFLRVAIEQAP